MKRYVLIALLSLFTTLTAAASDFVVTAESVDSSNIRLIKVEIPKQITEQEIAEIAKKIYLNGYGLTIIHFALQGNKSSVAWAVANFTPKLEIKIIGPSEQTLRDLIAYRPQHDGELIGSWLNTGVFNYRLTIVKLKNKKFVAYLHSSDGENHSEALQVKNVNGQVRFYVEKSRWNKYYTVGADGSLQYWDDSRGMYDRLEPVN